jgi:hypothetical protein
MTRLSDNPRHFFNARVQKSSWAEISKYVYPDNRFPVEIAAGACAAQDEYLNRRSL